MTLQPVASRAEDLVDDEVGHLHGLEQVAVAVVPGGRGPALS